MKKYNPKDIEKKWQDIWDAEHIYEADDESDREKFYALIEFPYPSGAGLHVGHPRPFTAMDVISRKKRMQGYNVLYPIGFDAFGLPTENYAIKTGRPPAEVTQENIDNFTRQLKSLGFGFDWSRKVDTTDPAYYKWTQWIFLKLFEKGLAYKQNIPINWCLNCKIGLANEEVVDGRCERCGGPVEKRDKEQWMLAITEYADSLLAGLEDVDYIPQAKTQQTNWIGRSEGARVKFLVEAVGNETKEVLEVFTTRPDTLFGATYMVVAPEHELIKKFKDKIENYIDVQKYVQDARMKSDLERTELQKEKTGIELKGIVAKNPVNGENIPIWVADYVLINYGTGAIMAVPAHDERDNEFAKKYGIDIKVVVKNQDGEDDPLKGAGSLKGAWVGNGIAINSAFLDGLKTPEAKTKMIKWLEENSFGSREVNYKLRDWIFSRQRYWGEPIPLVYCENCAAKQEFTSKGEERNPGWIPMSENNLPLELPHVEKYEPTDTGESPLAAMTDWVDTKCPRCGSQAKRETDTMPNWAGSSWYFLRYCDPNNNLEFASQEMLKKWMPVDWYNGGMEHVVLHLLYSRFWNQFLYDIGVVPIREPYMKRTSHGMILAKGGEKMSKSKGNVVNPDEMVDQFGADSLRTYIMFMGPFDQAVEWDTNGLVGVRRFLDKVWNLLPKAATSTEVVEDDQLTRKLHQTIKKVTNDIDKMAFNTAIAVMMELANEMNKQSEITQDSYEALLKILSPFAPHICEELWKELGNEGLVVAADWPEYNEDLCKEDVKILGVQINGKIRDEIEVSDDMTEDQVKELVLASPKVQKFIQDNEIKKFIVIKGRIISIVV